MSWANILLHVTALSTV